MGDHDIHPNICCCNLGQSNSQSRSEMNSTEFNSQSQILTRASWPSGMPQSSNITSQSCMLWCKLERRFQPQIDISDSCLRNYLGHFSTRVCNVLFRQSIAHSIGTYISRNCMSPRVISMWDWNMARGAWKGLERCRGIFSTCNVFFPFLSLEWPRLKDRVWLYASPSYLCTGEIPPIHS